MPKSLFQRTPRTYFHTWLCICHSDLLYQPLFVLCLFIYFLHQPNLLQPTATPLWNPVLISMNGHKLFNLMLVNIVLLSPSLCPPLPFTVPLKILLDTNMCSQSQKGNYSMTAVACLTWIRVNPIRKATNVTKTLNNAGNGCVNSLSFLSLN